MATLSAIKFGTPDGAEGALGALGRLQSEQLIKVLDAATVSWPEGAEHPKTRHARHLVGEGALGGMAWGMLFGLLFFIPIIGMAVGAGIGALSGKALGRLGIDERFVDEVKSKVTPGTSALFALTQDAVQERVAEVFRNLHGELIATNLSTDAEQTLREAFTPPAAEHP